jgi:hypothetical protein
MRRIADEEFAKAFQRWYKLCLKCIEIGSGYVVKAEK